MTMKRSEKAAELAKLKPEADGYLRERFASPKLAQAARADRGHDRMTPAEYAAHRMGRGTQGAEQAREMKLSHSRFRWMKRR
jgi:hypothetical protein